MEDGWLPLKGFANGKQIDLGRSRPEIPEVPAKGFRLWDNGIMYECELNEEGKKWFAAMFPTINDVSVNDDSLYSPTPIEHIEPPC